MKNISSTCPGVASFDKTLESIGIFTGQQKTLAFWTVCLVVRTLIAGLVGLFPNSSALRYLTLAGSAFAVFHLAKQAFFSNEKPWWNRVGHLILALLSTFLLVRNDMKRASWVLYADVIFGAATFLYKC